MLPVLLSVNKLSVSSYGLLLALGFIFSVFLIWRLARAWDLDEEKVLDLTLFTFLGGFLGSRIYFVIENLQYFIQNPKSAFLINQMPGFSFWGGLIGGWLTLYFFAKRKKMDFWQTGDIAAVGFLGGLIFSSIGCFLGGCDIGKVNDWFFAVPMAGVIGKRFPVQALEAILLFLVFLNLWSKSTRFHPRGKILGLSLIYIGSIKLLLQSLRESAGTDLFLSLVLICLGMNIFYKAVNSSLKADLKTAALFTYELITDSLTRKQTLVRLKKLWYNRKASLQWNLQKIKKNLRRLNVKVSYKNNKLH